MNSFTLCVSAEGHKKVSINDQCLSLKTYKIVHNDLSSMSNYDLMNGRKEPHTHYRLKTSVVGA